MIAIKQTKPVENTIIRQWIVGSLGGTAFGALIGVFGLFLLTWNSSSLRDPVAVWAARLHQQPLFNHPDFAVAIRMVLLIVVLIGLPNAILLWWWRRKQPIVLDFALATGWIFGEAGGLAIALGAKNVVYELGSWSLIMAGVAFILGLIQWLVLWRQLSPAILLVAISFAIWLVVGISVLLLIFIPAVGIGCQLILGFFTLREFINQIRGKKPEFKMPDPSVPLIWKPGPVGWVVGRLIIISFAGVLVGLQPCGWLDRMLEASGCQYVIEGPENGIRKMAFAPDGATFVLVGTDDKVQLWQTEPWTQIATLDGQDISFSPNPNPPTTLAIISGGEARLVQPQNVETLYKLKQKSRIRSLSFAPDGATMTALTDGGNIRSWRVSNGELLHSTDLSGNLPSSKIVFDITGEALAFVQQHPERNVVQFWHLDECSRQRTDCGPLIQIFEHEETVSSLAIVPGGEKLVTGTSDGWVHLWGENGEPLAKHIGRTVSFDPKVLLTERFGQFGHEIEIMTFGPDDTTLATGAADGTVLLWPLARESSFPVTLTNDGDIADLAFSPDGALLAAGTCMEFDPDSIISLCRYGQVRVWQVSNRKLIKTIEGYGRRVESLAFGPDSDSLAMVNSNGTVYLWNLQLGEE